MRVLSGCRRNWYNNEPLSAGMSLQSSPVTHSLSCAYQNGILHYIRF